MGILDFIGGKLEYKTVKAHYMKTTLNLEIADTFRKLSTGLMKHDGLPEDGGMLFMFSGDGRHGIWMKSMKFPIDIIWLDSKFRIVDIFNDAQPCKSIFVCPIYKPRKNTLYVIELSAGAAKKYGMKIGQSISFNV